MNCTGNPKVLYCGRGYLNRSFITLQGCTSSHMFPPLSVCTRHVLGRLQAKADVGVDHDLSNHTSLWSRFIAYSGSIREEIRPGFRSQPQTMCAGFPRHQTGDSVHWATVYLPHHSPPLGSALRTASNTYPTNTRN